MEGGGGTCQNDASEEQYLGPAKMNNTQFFTSGEYFFTDGRVEAMCSIT